MKFSIIIPTYNRAKLLDQTLKSLELQSWKDFEVIIFDDKSGDNTREIIEKYNNLHTTTIYSNVHVDRYIARWEAMKIAIGEWIYWMDDDDFLDPYALETIKSNIDKFPEYSCFNFGQVMRYLDSTWIRDAQELPKHFDSGLVGTGAFVFKRECLEHIETLPQVDNFYAFADEFGKLVDAWCQENGITEYTHYSAAEKPCGNPYGDDYAMVWLITRKFPSKKLNIAVYNVYSRTEDWIKTL